MKKIISFLILMIVILAVVAVAAKDTLIKVVAETAVTAVTGFKTEIGYLKYDFPSTINIRDLKISNPKGFEQPVFTQIPEIFVSLNLDQLLKQQAIHLNEVRFALEEVNIEKNRQGVSNVSLLTSVGGQKGQPAAAPKKSPAPAPKGKAMPFQLDRLVLTMHNVRYTDFSMGVPVKLSADLRIEKEVFQNITDPKALVNLILMKITKGTTFGNLGISPDLLQNGLSGVVSSGTDVLKGAQSAILNQASTAKLQGEGAQALQGTTGAVKETVSGLTDSAAGAMSSMFGKKKPDAASSDQTK